MLALLSALTLGATSPLPPESDRRLVAEAHAIVRDYGDLVWVGFSQAPLPVLLIGQERETLFCGPSTSGFETIALDPISRCMMQGRTRVLPVDLTASTDLGAVSVVQMGLPAALDGTREDWLVTFVHEAFHQHQRTLPGYGPAVEKIQDQLGQAGAQWMLDYQFPYAEPAVKAAFTEMSSAAKQFLAANTDQESMAAIRAYVSARGRAQEAAGLEPWLYFEFQVGQEGIARWVELKFATVAGDVRPKIAAVGQERTGSLLPSLDAIDRQGLNIWKRSAFYVFGAIEAQMLETLHPKWQHDYEANPFSIGTMLKSFAPATDAKD